MNPWSLRVAARVLRGGGVIAYPTEAVFGLGCDPWSWSAMERLLALKRRRLAKGVILIAASVDQLEPFVDWTAGVEKDTVAATWPGPITWLLPAARDVPVWLSGGAKTVAGRVTAHPQCIALCKLFGGALVSTSANVSGRTPARTALEVRRQFAGALDYILTGEVGGEAGPSEIRDARTGSTVRARVTERSGAQDGDC